MTYLRGATCAVILVCISLCHSVVYGQAESGDCQTEEIGLINGTFDSATGGWKYNSGGENKNGYTAEVLAGVRASNVLKLIPKLPQAPGDTCLDNRVLWQKDIKLGAPRTTQFVLRFDHLVEQKKASNESGLIAIFTIKRITSNGGTTNRESSQVSIASHPFEDGAEWTTSEVYVDIPYGSAEYGYSCDIMFESKNTLIHRKTDDDSQCYSEITFPEIMLDNVEILVMKPGCLGEEIGPTVDTQPCHCTNLNLCGGAQGGCPNPSFAEALLQGKHSENDQNDRNFYKYCILKAECCGNLFFLPRKNTETSDITITESENYYARDFDQSRYWTLCRSLSHCIADLNEDGIVNGSDLAMLLNKWGSDSADEACLSSDIDGNGQVGGSDLSILLSKWGSCL